MAEAAVAVALTETAERRPAAVQLAVGGGAGAFVWSALGVTPGQTLFFTVGAGGAGGFTPCLTVPFCIIGATPEPGGHGGDSTVTDGQNVLLMAGGGSGGGATDSTFGGSGGAGGQSQSPCPMICRAGANGTGAVSLGFPYPLFPGSGAPGYTISGFTVNRSNGGNGSGNNNDGSPGGDGYIL